jgi:hypothetical protein
MAMAMLRIGLILVGCAAALVYGLMHSLRTRRLAIAALIIVGALIILFGLWAFIVKTWLPATLYGALTPHPPLRFPRGCCAVAPGTIVSSTVEAPSLRSRELPEGAGVRVTPRPACGSARVGQPVGGQAGSGQDTCGARIRSSVLVPPWLPLGSTSNLREPMDGRPHFR